MRKIIFSIIAAFLFLIVFKTQVQAQESWIINRFASDIKIQQDGIVHITEIINADFGSIEKHGIYRDLPYVYEGENGKVYTEINNVQISRNNNNEKFEEIRNNSNLRLKIGNANRTISGAQQ